MSKEKYSAKECIEVIKANGVYNPNIQKYFDELEEILTEYEAIKNSNPSEALEKLEEIINYYNEPQYDVCECSYPNEFRDMWGKELITIKQALLKSQELAKENELLKAFITDCEKGDTPLKSALFREKRENELLKEIIKNLFDKGCPLHQYTDKEGTLTIEVDDECSIMRLGEFKGVDLDKKLKEVLDNE